jgi:hypothetical protein
VRQLRLEGFRLQLESTGAGSGVLAGCSGLTALQLQDCVLSDPFAAMRAIAALPDLQHLSITTTFGEHHTLLFITTLHRLTKLTHLALDTV